VSAEFLSGEDEMIQIGVVEEICDRLLDHSSQVYANDDRVIFKNAQVSVSAEYGVIEVEGHILDDEGLITSSSYCVTSEPDEAINIAVAILLSVLDESASAD